MNQMCRFYIKTKNCIAFFIFFLSSNFISILYPITDTITQEQQEQSTENRDVSKEQLQALTKRLAEQIKNIDIKNFSPEQNDGSEFGTRLQNGLSVVILSIVAAIAYGIVNDSVTARMCIEYFNTPAVPHHYQAMKDMGYEHPEKENSPTKIALLWGTIATWWVGAILGSGIALSSQAYSGLPALAVSDLIQPIGILLATMLGGAFLAGVTGYVLSANKIISFPNARKYLPADKQDLFAAVAFSHEAGYIIGEFGGLCLILWILRERIYLSRDLVEKKFMDLATSLLDEISDCKTQEQYAFLEKKLSYNNI